MVSPVRSAAGCDSLLAGLRRVPLMYVPLKLLVSFT